SWALQTTPNPSGTTTAALLGVSCTSSSACEAVGYATNSSNVTSTLAMRWNGTSWSAQATPNPSGQPVSELLSVSCATATACTAAGYAGTSANDSSTLAERWNGSSWALQATPNPSGATVSNLNGVTCATVSLRMAVGSSGPSPSSAAPLSELWNGTAWTIETNLATTAAFDAVACVSATACTAVGTLNGRARGPYVEVWNGSVWASRSSVDPIVGGPAVLTGVACTSASTCTAAGFYSTGSNVHTVLVESGPSWTTGAPVEPKGATTSGFTGISCASTATCIAVGYDDNGTGQVNLAERLKGGRWKILPTPNPSGATTSYLQGVSCPGASACEAVGAFGTNSGGGALAEVWNGTAWALQTVPNPAGASGVLQAVSCTSSSACLAV